MTVLMPSSAQEAVDAFGDGSGVVVLAGGTILMPEITHGRLRPERTVLLAGAGLGGIEEFGATLTIGAMTSVAEVAERTFEPLASAARGVADLEVRGQATLGGNLCAPPGAEAPRGDLQAPLIALGARVRSAGSDGERTEDVVSFLGSLGGGVGPTIGGGRLVLAVEVDQPLAGVYVAQGRPHAHSYTILSAAAALTTDGLRVAVGGAGPRAVRASSVEQAVAAGASAGDAGAKVLDDVDPQDDALASAWYRKRVLPILVTRALNQIQGA